MASGYPRGRDQRNRAHMPVQPCRSCRESMVWVTTPGGARLPLNYEPSDGVADVTIVERPDDWRLGVTIRDEELRAEMRALGFTFRERHLCPAEADRRRPRERADIDK